MKESLTQKSSLKKFLDKIKEANTKNPLESFLDILPGVDLNKRAGEFLKFNEEGIESLEAILDSMTEEELGNPSIINKSRRERIARGAGVNKELIKEFLSKYRKVKGVSRKKRKLRKLKERMR